LGALDNVVVCQNMPLAVVDNARPNTGGHNKWLVELARLHFLLVSDLDYCRLYLLADRADGSQKIVRRRRSCDRAGHCRRRYDGWARSDQ
jgi:hypothetical protein